MSIKGKSPASTSSSGEAISDLASLIGTLLRKEITSLQDVLLVEISAMRTKLDNISNRMDHLESTLNMFASSSSSTHAGVFRPSLGFANSLLDSVASTSTSGELLYSEVKDQVNANPKDVSPPTPVTKEVSKENLNMFTTPNAAALTLGDHLPQSSEDVVSSMMRTVDNGRVITNDLSVKDKTVLYGIAGHIPHKQYNYQILNETPARLQINIFRKGLLTTVFGKSEGATIFPGGRWNFGSAWSHLIAIVEEADGKKQRFSRIRRYAPGDEISYFRIGSGAGPGKRHLYMSAHMERSCTDKCAPSVHVWGDADDGLNTLEGSTTDDSSGQWRESFSGGNHQTPVSSMLDEETESSSFSTSSDTDVNIGRMDHIVSERPRSKSSRVRKPDRKRSHHR